MMIGFAICLSKLFNHSTAQKYGYRDVSMWIVKNTAPTDIIAVPDLRITFYAERKGWDYTAKKQKSNFADSDYVVKIINSRNDTIPLEYSIEEKYMTQINKKKKDKLVIYKVLR